MGGAAVLERVRNPRRVGSFPPDAADVGTGEAGTLDEGTVVRIQVRIEHGRVAEARFKVFGCSAAIASASLVAEWLEGEPIAGSGRVTADRVVAELVLPDERRPIAALVVAAADRALADGRGKEFGRRVGGAAAGRLGADQ